MCRWRITSSEGALWLVVLFLSLEEVLGTTSSLGTDDKNESQSRTRWCKERNACARCEETKRPKCSKHAELLLGADLCQCCFSCVALRDLGESCGSQLSTWSDITGADPVSSTILILATSQCREGLVCVNFTCLESSGDLSSAKSLWLRNDEGLLGSEKDDDDVANVFGQDTLPFEVEDMFPSAKRHRQTTAPLWEAIPVNHGDPNLPRTKISVSSSTPITPTPSLTESRQKPQPCYAEPQETKTFFSYQSDDVLGRVATTTFDDKRFQVVYSGDFLSELKVLLNVIDTFHGDSPLHQCEVDSLLDNFLVSSSFADDGFTSEVEEETATSWNPQLRSRREVEDVAGFPPPENIQEILIRGASAHHEYVDKSRSYQDSEISEKNASVTPLEATSQEDESTVRLHITNRPRKVQTLVDFEEDGEEVVVDEEDRRILHLANRGHAKETGKLFPFADGQTGVLPATPQSSTSTKTTPQITGPKKTVRTQTAPEFPRPPSTQTLETIDERLRMVEMRMEYHEQVVQEIAKWSEFGPSSPMLDCFVYRTPDLRLERRGPEPDEHIVLASGIDPVRIRGGRRKSNGRIHRGDFHDAKDAEAPGIFAPRKMALRGWSEPRNRNFFRTLIENRSPRRPGAGRSAQSLCRSHGHAIDEGTPRRTVQRSVSSMNPDLRNSSAISKRTFANQTGPHADSDDRSLPTLQETQIPVPRTLEKEATILQDREKRESTKRRGGFPGESPPAVETTISTKMSPWKMIFSESEEENEAEGALVQTHTSKAEKKTERSKRAVKRVDGDHRGPETLRNTRGLAGRLFELEMNTKPDANREHRRLASPLIVDVDEEFRNTPEPMASRLLFRNSDPVQTAESTATRIPAVLEDAGNPDPHTPPYSITDHGNSTIRIEEISEAEYDGLPKIHDPSNVEDDFDHIYESVEAGVEDGDFDYDVATNDRVEYVDSSSVEMTTETSLEMGPWSVMDSWDGIRPVFLRERNRRSLGIREDEECGTGREAKREIPLLLFGSTGKHEPKTIVWPSKWTGYQRDRILGSGRLGNMQGSVQNSRPLAKGAPARTTNDLPTTTTESMVIQNHLGNGEVSYEAKPKISGVDRRGRKNRRKLVWR